MTKSNKFTKNDSILQFVENLEASKLGCDEPEAVLDGFKAIFGLDWLKKRKEDKLRFVLHLTDAPPHGTMFNKDEDCEISEEEESEENEENEKENSKCKCGEERIPILSNSTKKNCPII